jgi:hypothetical protein
VITKLQWSHGGLNSATNFTKPEKNNKIFLGFLNFETRTEGNSKQSKIFLDFSNNKPKIGNKANQDWKMKEQTKRNNRNIFGLFVFWIVEIRARTTKKRKKAKHGYTKY